MDRHVSVAKTHEILMLSLALLMHSVARVKIILRDCVAPLHHAGPGVAYPPDACLYGSVLVLCKNP